MAYPFNLPTKFFPLCLILLVVISLTSFQFATMERQVQQRGPTAYKSEVITENEWLSIEQDDPRLLRYIQRHHLFPPSTLPYNLSHPERDQGNLADFYDPMKKLLQNQKGGFFVEAGSNDGELASTTLGFERFHGWTGLCVEPSPIEHVNWKSKHRRCWFADVCLSIVRVPRRETFLHEVGHSIASHLGSIGEPARKKNGMKWIEFNVTCFPVASLLNALEVNVVDVFNLDVEGVEFEVLKTIPYDKILIRIFTVELHSPTLALSEALKDFMSSKGYALAWEGGHDTYPESRIYLYASKCFFKAVEG